MLFMVTSRPKAGTTREQLIEHLTRRLHPSTWDLIRHGVLSQVLYMNRASLRFSTPPASRRAKAMIEAGMERLELFDLEAVPVNQFPHFA